MNARAATLLLAALLGPALLPLPAQKNGFQTPRADGQSYAALQGSRPALLGAGEDSAIAIDPSTVLNTRIVFARSAEQQAALDRFETEVLDKSSANYRKWLTPEEFGKLYGPGDADVERAVAWLQSQGFKVNPVPPARVDVSFSGSVHQVEQAFHTSIHAYLANGQR